MARRLELDETMLGRILEQVNGLEYGAVLITVHDGRIVQIERTERKRYENTQQVQAGRKVSYRK